MASKNFAALTLAVLFFIAVFSSGYAAPKRHAPGVPPPPTQEFDFDNCDLPTVLKVLGQVVHWKLLVDPALKGTISMRLSDMTPE